ncbi:Metallo-dependent phosphatase [Dendrothele bispora CBS 962.96]|uniref:Metallo-dependent phosphatase n=1 Tax=Dendrothele bispora (strain CBS 962.96) TaxID=1314807 RepID=A0A4S8KKZ1_DENBC|nr:Metallo-dependent phosphatase [Dendrothele bispora CBS 962.96]
MSQTKQLNIVHWNDVYNISPQKPNPQSSETFDVSQFAQIVNDIRAKWSVDPDGKKNGLSFFSGDLFSPSVESSITRGSQMVPVMNYIAPDVALAGNHDFDFGYPQLVELAKDCNFPWLLSNITDSNTSKIPAGLQEFSIIERAGLKIGVVGLVGKDWIEAVASWPPNFVYKDLVEAGLELSKRLRDPAGEYKCDLILALTHCRLPHDIEIAKKLGALSPNAQKANSIASTHGVDIILGGHDHFLLRV